MTDTRACVVRRVVGTRGWARRLVLAVAGEALVGYFCYHLWRLSGPRFDYDFNMFALVVLASAQCMGWFAWCNWMRRGEQRARERQFAAELDEYLNNEKEKKQADEENQVRICAYLPRRLRVLAHSLVFSTRDSLRIK